MNGQYLYHSHNGGILQNTQIFEQQIVDEGWREVVPADQQMQAQLQLQIQQHQNHQIQMQMQQQMQQQQGQQQVQQQLQQIQLNSQMPRPSQMHRPQMIDTGLNRDVHPALGELSTGYRITGWREMSPHPSPNMGPQPVQLVPSLVQQNATVVNQSLNVTLNPQSNSLRKMSRAWAKRAQVPATRTAELDQLVSLAEATYISKSRVRDLVAIDQGSFGQIYSATLDMSPVAVKELSTQNGSSVLASKMREILLELTILVRLRHPNIVTFWGTSTEFPQSEEPYMGFVFELCDKGSLYKMLHTPSKPRLSPKQKVHVAAQVGHGLSYLHTKRKDDKRAIVHRDISARNILLSGSMNNLVVKIADFGVARVMVNETLATTTISGSPPYMSPEQLIGSPLTVQCDIWGVGVLIWELITESIPWATPAYKFPNIEQMVQTVVHRGEILSVPSDKGMLYPLEIAQLARQCFQMKGEDRPRIQNLTEQLVRCYEAM